MVLMTNTMVAAAEKNAAWALETFGYLSPQYQEARQRLYNCEDRLAEAERQRREEDAALARLKAVDRSTWNKW